MSVDPFVGPSNDSAASAVGLSGKARDGFRCLEGWWSPDPPIRLPFLRGPRKIPEPWVGVWKAELIDVSAV